MPRAIDHKIEAIARKQGRNFLRRQVLEQGGDDMTILRRTKAGAWERGWFPGGLRLPGASGFEHDQWSLLLAAGATARSSHLAGARLYGLDGLPADVKPAVTVLVRRQIALPEGWRIHVDRRLASTDLAKIRRIPGVTPARVVIDCAALLQPDDLELLYESARTLGLLDDQRLLRRLAAHRRPGQRGLRTLELVLDRRDLEVKDSVMEVMFIQLLRELGLPRPVVHYRVHDEAGTFIAEVDVAYPGLCLFWELDSWAWHGRRPAFERDRQKGNALLDNGTPVRRLTWRMLTVDRVATGRRILAAYEKAVGDLDQSRPPGPKGSGLLRSSRKP